MGEVFEEYYDTAGNYHYTDTETGHHVIRADNTSFQNVSDMLDLFYANKHLYTKIERCEASIEEREKMGKDRLQTLGS